MEARQGNNGQSEVNVVVAMLELLNLTNFKLFSGGYCVCGCVPFIC